MSLLLPAALVFFVCVSVVAGFPAFVGVPAAAGTPRCVPAFASVTAAPTVLLLFLLLFCVLLCSAVAVDFASAGVPAAVDFYACCFTEQVSF